MNKRILSHFKKVDQTLYSQAVLIKLKPIKKDKPDNYFLRLCRGIISQQLSNKAGDVIFDRFLRFFGEKAISPYLIKNISDENLRSVGISFSKVKYLKNLAEAIVSGALVLDKLDLLKDEEVINTLIKIKGIGRWTAEMFLMFVLARENIFSFGDLGLTKGLIKIYKLSKKPTKQEAEDIVRKWSPYKTYGSRILWKAQDL